MEEMRFWATVHRESGYIRDVEQAEGKDMAKKLLLAKYTPEYRKEFDVKPVLVTIDTTSTE